MLEIPYLFKVDLNVILYSIIVRDTKCLNSWFEHVMVCSIITIISNKKLSNQYQYQLLIR